MRLDVSPLITSDGVIASLIGLAANDKIKRSANPPTKIGSGATVTVSGNKTTLAIAASMGFAGMVDVKAEFNSTYYIIEMKTVEEPVDGVTGGVVQKEYYGVAVRICVRAWAVGADVSATYQMASAKASANAAGVTYQIDVLGIDTTKLASLPGLISGSVGPFDISKLQAIGVLFSELTQYVGSKPDECVPQLMAVEIDLKETQAPYLDSSSSLFGLGRIGHAYNEIDALKQIPKSANPPIIDGAVADLYAAIVGSNINPPNHTQFVEAQDILKIDVNGLSECGVVPATFAGKLS